MLLIEGLEILSRTNFHATPHPSGWVNLLEQLTELREILGYTY